MEIRPLSRSAFKPHSKIARSRAKLLLYVLGTRHRLTQRRVMEHVGVVETLVQFGLAKEFFSSPARSHNEMDRIEKFLAIKIDSKFRLSASGHRETYQNK